MNPSAAIASRALLGLSALLVTFPARATYSIVATDQATQQVGGAVTSCVSPQSVATVYGSAPGHGGINAQAASNTAGRDRGVMLLNMGVAPADIIQQITAASFDPNARTRQYGVADLSGRAAGFTGAGAMDYKEDRQNTLGTFTYSVQGNILTSKAVLDQAEAGFRGGGCDLPERLMLALEEGAKNGQGDSRCTPRGIPSDSASIQVDLAGAAPRSYLFISLTESSIGSVSPLIRLRSMFDTWRTTHPCATGDGGVIDAGPRDASAGDAGRPDAGDARADVASDARESGAAGGGAGGTAGAGGSGIGRHLVGFGRRHGNGHRNGHERLWRSCQQRRCGSYDGQHDNRQLRERQRHGLLVSRGVGFARLSRRRRVRRARRSRVRAQAPSFGVASRPVRIISSHQHPRGDEPVAHAVCDDRGA